MSEATTVLDTHPRVLLRLPAVKQRTGMSRTTIYRLMKSGEFPAPVRLSDRAVGWRSDELAEWESKLEKVAV